MAVQQEVEKLKLGFQKSSLALRQKNEMAQFKLRQVQQGSQVEAVGLKADLIKSLSDLTEKARADKEKAGSSQPVEPSGIPPAKAPDPVGGGGGSSTVFQMFSDLISGDKNIKPVKTSEPTAGQPGTITDTVTRETPRNISVRGLNIPGILGGITQGIGGLTGSETISDFGRSISNQKLTTTSTRPDPDFRRGMESSSVNLANKMADQRLNPGSNPREITSLLQQTVGRYGGNKQVLQTVFRNAKIMQDGFVNDAQNLTRKLSTQIGETILKEKGNIDQEDVSVIMRVASSMGNNASGRERIEALIDYGDLVKNGVTRKGLLAKLDATEASALASRASAAASRARAGVSMLEWEIKTIDLATKEHEQARANAKTMDRGFFEAAGMSSGLTSQQVIDNRKDLREDDGDVLEGNLGRFLENQSQSFTNPGVNTIPMIRDTFFGPGSTDLDRTRFGRALMIVLNPQNSIKQQKEAAGYLTGQGIVLAPPKSGEVRKWAMRPSAKSGNTRFLGDTIRWAQLVDQYQDRNGVTLDDPMNTFVGGTIGRHGNRAELFGQTPVTPDPTSVPVASQVSPGTTVSPIQRRQEIKGMAQRKQVMQGLSEATAAFTRKLSAGFTGKILPKREQEGIIGRAKGLLGTARPAEE